MCIEVVTGLKELWQAGQVWLCANLTIASTGHGIFYLNLLLEAEQSFLFPMVL